MWRAEWTSQGDGVGSKEKLETAERGDGLWVSMGVRRWSRGEGSQGGGLAQFDPPAGIKEGALRLPHQFAHMWGRREKAVEH